jgi:hypothetical protein
MVAEDLGDRFVLPPCKQAIDLPSVGDGVLDEPDLFGRDRAVDETAILPASPVVVRAVPGVGVGRATAVGLPARPGARVQRA